MQHLINGLGPNPPIILGVHHSLNLILGDKLLPFTRTLLILIYLQVIIVDIGREANIAHRREHLILHIRVLLLAFRAEYLVATLERRVIILVHLTHVLLLNIENAEVGGGMLLILLVHSLYLVQLLLLNLDLA